MVAHSGGPLVYYSPLSSQTSTLSSMFPRFAPCIIVLFNCILVQTCNMKYLQVLGYPGGRGKEAKRQWMKLEGEKKSRGEGYQGYHLVIRFTQGCRQGDHFSQDEWRYLSSCTKNEKYPFLSITYSVKVRFKDNPV